MLIHTKVWDEITYPFWNFNGCTVEDREDREVISSHTLSWCNYLSMLGLKLTHVNKRSPVIQPANCFFDQWKFIIPLQKNLLQKDQQLCYPTYLWGLHCNAWLPIIAIYDGYRCVASSKICNLATLHYFFEESDYLANSIKCYKVPI